MFRRISFKKGQQAFLQGKWRRQGRKACLPVTSARPARTVLGRASRGPIQYDRDENNVVQPFAQDWSKTLIRMVRNHIGHHSTIRRSIASLPLHAVDSGSVTHPGEGRLSA